MKRLLVVGLGVLAACGGGGDDGASPDGARSDAPPPGIDSAGPLYIPGDPIRMSMDSLQNDEDPFLLRARDGSIYVAWFSQTSQNDILISRTTDGVTWTPPAHISTGPATDYAPSLYQDAAGIIHATWFRMGPPGRIVYNRTAAADAGLVWDAAGEVDVTAGNGTDDWVPSIAGAPGGGLVVAFTRNTCPPPDTCWGIASATSPDGATWSGVTPVVPASGGLEHHLPALANTGSALELAWVPYDATAGVPWEGATGAHIRMLHSATGGSWDDPRTVVPRDPAAVAVFPTLYADHAGRWYVAWLGASATGQGVVELPLDAIGTGTPAPLPIPGYSPRVVATPTPGVFVAAWVAGPDGDRDVYVRVFAKN